MDCIPFSVFVSETVSPPPCTVLLKELSAEVAIYWLHLVLAGNVPISTSVSRHSSARYRHFCWYFLLSGLEAHHNLPSCVLWLLKKDILTFLLLCVSCPLQVLALVLCFVSLALLL